MTQTLPWAYWFIILRLTFLDTGRGSDIKFKASLIYNTFIIPNSLNKSKCIKTRQKTRKIEITQNWSKRIINMASDISKNKYYKTRWGKTQNEKWRLSESKLRRHYIVAVVQQQQRGQHQWWRRSTSATRPDPPTRCYIKTCQLQRRFISHSIDSSLPYFNRPIHQERSDSLLCQNYAADIQRGLTKFLWFFDIYWIKKRNKFQRRYDWKRGEHLFVFWRKLFYFTWGQWRRIW